MELSKQQIEQWLSEMGKKGLLLGILADEDIEAILAHTPTVAVSEHFKERALEAMARAQDKRN